MSVDTLSVTRLLDNNVCERERATNRRKKNRETAIVGPVSRRRRGERVSDTVSHLTMAREREREGITHKPEAERERETGGECARLGGSNFSHFST